MNIDSARLRADLKALAAESRALKAVLGTRWERPMKDEQHMLARVRWRTTELCILRAAARGKRHVPRPPRAWGYTPDARELDAWHAAVAARVAKDYALEAEAAANEGAQ